MRNKSEKQPGVPDESLISQAKAAEMCGMTREAIHDLVSRGRLRSLEVEGRALVYLKEVAVISREHDERDARDLRLSAGHLKDHKDVNRIEISVPLAPLKSPVDEELKGNKG